MPTIPIFQIDAFTDHLFSGNPAAVCPLTEWLPDGVMQAIAAENNLSETAFFVPDGDGYAIRWFTPGAEIDLAGHPTLATAHLLFSRLDPSRDRIRFNTRKSGDLLVARDGDAIVMDFPARPARECEPDSAVVKGLGTSPLYLLASDHSYMAVLADEEHVRSLDPDFTALRKAEKPSVIVTARGETCDFVSRFFAPALGVSEDPVTGSAHCTLTPYWAGRLGKSELSARQVSARGGELFCVLHGDRVVIKGRCVFYMEGSISL